MLVTTQVSIVFENPNLSDASILTTFNMFTSGPLSCTVTSSNLCDPAFLSVVLAFSSAELLSGRILPAAGLALGVEVRLSVELSTERLLVAGLGASPSLAMLVNVSAAPCGKSRHIPPDNQTERV